MLSFNDYNGESSIEDTIIVLSGYQVTGQDGTGLGAEFQPSVKASCVGTTMTIRVDTDKPFEGIIHGITDR